MIIRIIVFIVGTSLGISMLMKTEWYLQMVGRNEWAEKHLGFEGGSRLLYKLIGFAIIFLSWIYAFNWMNNLLEFFLGGLFGR